MAGIFRMGKLAFYCTVAFLSYTGIAIVLSYHLPTIDVAIQLIRSFYIPRYTRRLTSETSKLKATCFGAKVSYSYSTFFRVIQSPPTLALCGLFEGQYQVTRWVVCAVTRLPLQAPRLHGHLHA